MTAADVAIFRMIFTGEGAVELTWEQGTRCPDCFTDDTYQPTWGHQACGGLGCLYSDPVAVRGLYRSRSAWTSRRASGERDLIDAQLTLPKSIEPGYTDERVRDRFTVVKATADAREGAVFYPVAEATPFIFAGAQHAWRVKVQGLKQAQRVLPQP